MNKRTFLRKILHTKDFFFMFAKHLDEIWVDYSWWWIDDEEDIVIMADGTNGWNIALKNTCKELDVEDCYKYYDSLDWRVSDELDMDMVMLLEAIVFDEDGKRIKNGGVK